MNDAIFDVVIGMVAQRRLNGLARGIPIGRVQAFAHGRPGDGTRAGQAEALGRPRAQRHTVACRVPRPVAELARGQRQLQSLRAFTFSLLRALTLADTFVHLAVTVLVITASVSRRHFSRVLFWTV